MTASLAELCHCGRPLRHTGRHIGYHPPAVNAAVPVTGRKTKLRTMVEQEIKTCHASIVRLKDEIRSRQAELLDVEAKLQPLIALLNVYRDLALPAPERPPAAATVPAKPVAVNRQPVAHEAGPEDDEADFEPQEVEFNQVVAWAAVRNIRFKSWDDLPAINRRREEFELPTFKRKLAASINGRL